VTRIPDNADGSSDYEDDDSDDYEDYDDDDYEDIPDAPGTLSPVQIMQKMYP
jgi:hypothetical protein